MEPFGFFVCFGTETLSENITCWFLGWVVRDWGRGGEKGEGVGVVLETFGAELAAYAEQVWGDA